MEHARYVLVPHPIQDATDDEMRDKARAALNDILDALTKCGFWRDDAQVCAGTILKKYVVNDAKPGVLVSVGEAADPREARRSLHAVVSSHCAHIRNPYTLEEICEQVAGAEYNAELMLQHLLLWCSANDKIQP